MSNNRTTPTSISRRTFVGGAMAIGASAATSSSSFANTKPIWYSTAYAEGLDGLNKLYEARTGKSVEFVRLAATKATQTFEQEVKAGQVRCSIIGVTQPAAIRDWGKRGLLLPYKHSERSAYPNDVIVDEVSTPATCFSNCIAFNGDYINKDEGPKTYEDLLNPKWKGKMAMGDAVTSTSTLIWFAAMRDLYGMKYLEALAKQNIMIHTSGGQVLDSLISGERPLAPVVLQYHVARGISQGANLFVRYPQEGVAVIYEFMAIPAKAPAMEEAKKFMDFALGREAQTLWQEKYGMSSLRTDMPPLKSDRGLLGSSQIIRLKSSVEESIAYADQNEQLVNEFSKLFR